ncbi:MAG: acyl-CoA reductase, partial [Flavobacteriales bacterium]
YDYNKAIFLMGGHELTENGFLLMKEDTSLQSPVSMLFYEFYEDLDKVKDYINENEDLLQCVVSKEDIVKKNTHFGETQKPQLWDYADNTDTIEFLTTF